MGAGGACHASAGVPGAPGLTSWWMWCWGGGKEALGPVGIGRGRLEGC